MAINFRQYGFTLIELMVVLAIISLLTAIGMPRIAKIFLSQNLHSAKPYLMTIASKMRTAKIQSGSFIKDWDDYSTSSGDYTTPYDEQYLVTTLGVDLKNAADFCFMVRWQNGNFISDSGDQTPDGDRFEVWAVLRDQDYYGATSANDKVSVADISVSCTTADNKLDATGWVDSDKDKIGSEGRVVVLRDPPTAEGLDSDDRNGRIGTQLDWIGGTSISDGLL